MVWRCDDGCNLLTSWIFVGLVCRAKQEVYISPSDTIMSPCTAKLSAYKSKHFLK